MGRNSPGCEIRTNCCIEETQSGPADHNPRDPNPAFAQHTPSGHRLMGSKIHDDVHSRLAFERKFCCVPTDALVGSFDFEERQDLNDVSQALLEHRYRHATQLTLSFKYCKQLSDVSALGTALASLTSLQRLTLSFRECSQLSDVSAIFTALASLTSLQELTLFFYKCEQLSDVTAVGTGLAALTALQKMTLDFYECSKLSDVSTVGTALASLTALQELTLSFDGCRQLSDVSAVGTGLASLTSLQKLTLFFWRCEQLPEAIQTGFDSRDEFLKAIGTLQ